MTNSSRAFVAIIGGFYDLKKDAVAFTAAKTKAAELGAELAKAGLGLVVYFSNEESLEPHVVAGYVAALPAGAGVESIRVRFAESQNGLVSFPEQQTRADVFQTRNFPSTDWEAPFYRSLVEASEVDAVLLMAGGHSVLIAGQIAVARPLPTLAVDAFPGTAKTIRSELARSPGYPSTASHSSQQMVAWLKNECEVRAQKRDEIRRREERYAKLDSQKDKTLWAGGALTLLLAALAFGIALAPPPKFYPVLMFAGLIFAGATGALVRAVFWGAETTAPTTSLVLGSVAGLVVGLAYLIPQFVGAPGVLAPTANAVLATDKIQFLSAVLVAIPAGVGFDTVFNRLKRQAEDLQIGPASGK